MDAIKWTIKQFYGGSEVLMRAHFGLPSVGSDEADADSWRKRSIQVRSCAALGCRRHHRARQHQHHHHGSIIMASSSSTSS